VRKLSPYLLDDPAVNIDGFWLVLARNAAEASLQFSLSVSVVSVAGVGQHQLSQRQVVSTSLNAEFSAKTYHKLLPFQHH